MRYNLGTIKKERQVKQEVEGLRAERNKISKQIGACMAQGKREEAEELKKQVAANAQRVQDVAESHKPRVSESYTLRLLGDI